MHRPLRIRSLGRSRTLTPIRSEALRLCPVCNTRRRIADFVARKGRRALNLFCNDCRVNNPEGVRQFFQTNDPEVARAREQIFNLLRERARRWILRGKEVKGVNDGRGLTAEQYARKYLNALDRIAAIIANTYAEKGDAFTVADDEGLGMIRDALLDVDDTLIERNKNKRLSR